MLAWQRGWGNCRGQLESEAFGSLCVCVQADLYLQHELVVFCVQMCSACQLGFFKGARRARNAHSMFQNHNLGLPGKRQRPPLHCSCIAFCTTSPILLLPFCTPAHPSQPHDMQPLQMAPPKQLKRSVGLGRPDTRFVLCNFGIGISKCTLEFGSSKNSP